MLGAQAKKKAPPGYPSEAFVNNSSFVSITNDQ